MLFNRSWKAYQFFHDEGWKSRFLRDILVTTVTIVSAIIAGVTGWQIDAYMGVLVSVFVIFAGYSIAKETLEPLLGQAVDREMYCKITEMVEGYEGIVGTHDLIIHSYGPSHKMATIHAEVPNDIDFETPKTITDRARCSKKWISS